MIQAKEDENIEFKWGNKRGVGGRKKDVQFYESFTFDGVEYMLYDSVYMYADIETEPYIGKIIKIWENSDKTKRVKILWFFRPCEISNYLEANETSKNELFLASGDGVGLANVNPLEAIAGKCNVICISKDSRNPQPSNEELQMADFIFFRIFDVGRHVILDKIDDKIAQVDVKFLLNKVNSQKSHVVPERDSIKKEISGNAIVAADGTTLSSEMNAMVERINLKTDDSSIDPLSKEDADSIVLLPNQRSSVGQKPASFSSDELDEIAKIDHAQGDFSGGKTISHSKVKDNSELITLDVKQKSSLGEKPTSNIVGKLAGEATISDPHKDTASDKIRSRTEDEEIADPKPLLVRQRSSLGEKHASKELDRIDKNKKQESMSNDKIISRSIGDPIRPSKIDKLGGSSEASGGNKEKIVHKLIPDSKRCEGKASEVHAEVKVKALEDSCRFANRALKNDKLDGSFKHCDAKAVDRTATTTGEISKRKLVKDPNETEILSFKKRKLDEKLTKFANGKLPRESPREVSNDVSNTDSKILEVTRRPEADKIKWFKGLPWEERIKAAHAEGRIVLLQNLDPSFTGLEVEDIVWHALKQSCTAKMIPCTAFSSPHSGQAFAIFKTREAAETAVTKLDEGCLMTSYGREKLYLLHIVLSPTRLSMIWLWSGAFYRNKQIKNGNCCTSNMGKS
ncbi:protein ANTI-SILENCING 1 isoform X2 [Ricinus communis]|uniref:protein ANTI-SILENCING 1 isoform X2 n=1 Tax=Ricinus communis TaxID=3988 RepID=UPI0007723BE1|nr:protein ANTI-SILENCING 1 isoform X2 [Ricinus communis]|eukprot:XP_015573152.1 protein ANTI-SILENCING 1 isoform X2 [Ricinus communis]